VGPSGPKTPPELLNQFEWRKSTIGICETFNRDRSVCTRRIWTGTYTYDTRENLIYPTEPPAVDVEEEVEGGVDAFIVIMLVFGLAVLGFLGLYAYLKKKAEKEEMEKQLNEVSSNFSRRSTLGSTAAAHE